MRRTAALLGAVALVAAACGDDGSRATDAATPASADFEVAELTPLLVESGPDVVPVRGSDGRVHLLWEVPVQNATTLDLAVTGVEVEGAGETVLTLDADEVAEVLEVVGTRTPDAQVGPAQRAYVFLTASFATRAELPDELVHSVTVEADPLSEPITTTGGAVAVDADALVPVLGPPLEPGTGYVAADGCCASTRHVRAGLPVEGGYWFVQRFAIDWEQVDDEGSFVDGDPADPESYAVYGRDVLAVADGTVVHVVDGLADQVPGELPGTSLPLDEIDGNSVVLDIGDGLYVAYAHLRRRSVSVAVGDRVARGERIGAVGNTGNSSAPHLHLHVADGPSSFAANGRPYVIDAFSVTGRGASTEDLDAVENTEEPLPIDAVDDPGPRAEALPLDLSIVGFAAPGG